MTAEVRSRLICRSDDTVEKCKVRLSQYSKNVAAIKGFYKKQCVTVNGNDNAEKVTERVEKVLNETMKKKKAF